MASPLERLDLIRKRMPGTRRRELAVSWQRALTRGSVVVVTTLILLLVIGAGRPEGADAFGTRGFVGLAAVLAIIITLFTYYLERFQGDKLKPFDSPARTWLFGGLMLLLLVIIKIELLLGVDPKWLVLLAPVPTIGVVLAVVYEQRFAFDNMLLVFALLVIMLSLHGGKDSPVFELANLVKSNDGSAAIDLELLREAGTRLADTASALATLFIGTCVAIIMTRNLRNRTKLLKVGLFTGLAMGTAVMGFQLMEFGGLTQHPDAVDQLTWIALAVLHGILTGMVVSSVVPLLEHAFGMVTEMRLLELEDGNHPLIRMMIERAPGTYMHTQNVARIASAGVEAIGGNALLTRVGTLFHDVGKMVRPEYFTENEPNSKLYHDRLTPQMSALIILGHVKEGVVLARHYKLPRILEDFITGHHGTSCINYFYRMAKMQAKKGERIEQGMFRYPGPKPQTREAAIVAIADLVEAAGRAKLDGKQTPATIKKFVHECVMMKLEDGQFEECDLTLRDLRIAEDAMVKTLASMYHHRVKYPDDPDAKLARLAVMEKEEFKRELAKRRERILTQ